MNSLYVGFSRVDVTPMLGVSIDGYFKVRLAEGVLDALEANALAIRSGDTTVVLISLDNLGAKKVLLDGLRAHIAQVTGLPVEAIFLHTTHTHTAGSLRYDTDGNPLVKQYYDFVCLKLADAAVMAIADLKPARMGLGVGEAKNVAFVRRFRMKDGSVRTNPGVNNPDIVAPIGDVDERVNVVRFQRERDDIVLVNVGNHPDTVGGCKISADWPGFLRRRVEKALDNTRCIFFNGAQGDLNHVNVHPTPGDFNDMFLDFDDVSRGYGHARHMGNVVAGAVLSVYDKVTWQDAGDIRLCAKTISLPSNRGTAEEVEAAREISRLHNAGQDDRIPFTGMALTTVVAEAARMLRLEHGPDAFELELIGLAVGNVAFLGIPGEPFNGVGRGIKEAKGWDMVLPCALVNGDEAYFPMQDAYDEGGYEARSSSFKAGVAERIIQESCKLLDSLK